MNQVIEAVKRQSNYIAIGIILLIQVFLLYFNGDTYGGADNISHYQIARYAFKYRELFLDLWGKPVYTTLLAPFAILGFKTAKVFNLLVAIFTLILTAKLSERIFKGSSLATILLIAFSPVYFFLMITCLTEVLFSLTLIIAVYLFYKNKLAFSAIVLSFIPFVRSEGMVLFPVFALAYILRRSYLPVVLLAVGTVFYSLIGLLAFNDILWIIHKFPYSMGESVYGSGSLFHFVKTSNFIFGVPFLIFLVLGLAFWMYQSFRNFSLKNEDFILFIVVTGSWIVYFAAHSYVWWKGTGGSLGLTRVIGGVIPVAALTAAKGIQFLSEKIKIKWITTGMIFFLVAAQVFMLFFHYDLPMKSGPVQPLVEKSVSYLKQNSFAGKVYYFDPDFLFQLEIDPYDQSKSNWLIADKIQPSNSMNYGDILLWDAHFGPNEGGVLLENLMKDPHLQLLKSILPDESFKVLGGYEYGIYIFRKVEQKIVLDKKQKLDQELNFSNLAKEHLETVDGKKMFRLDENTEFSPAISIPVAEIQAKDYFEINASVHFISNEQFAKDAVLLVFSVEVDHKALSYNRMDFATVGSGNGQVQELNYPLKINAAFPPGAVMNLYVWNKDKKKLLLGDLRLIINSY